MQGDQLRLIVEVRERILYVLRQMSDWIGCPGVSRMDIP